MLNDLVYVEKVVGAGEVAISDYRSSHPNLEMLRQLAWEVKLGSMIGRKAGVVHLHVGDGSKGLAPLISLIRGERVPNGDVRAHPHQPKPARCSPKARITPKAAV